MKHQAAQLADALARLLDVVSRTDADAVAIDACGREWLAAEQQLADVVEAGGDARTARDELERCASLRRLLRTRTGGELSRIDDQLELVRERVRRLPVEQPATSGGSCDLRA